MREVVDKDKNIISRAHKGVLDSIMGITPQQDLTVIDLPFMHSN